MQYPISKGPQEILVLIQIAKCCNMCILPGLFTRHDNTRYLEKLKKTVILLERDLEGKVC